MVVGNERRERRMNGGKRKGKRKEGKTKWLKNE